jgi:hypothetical protein
MAPLVAAAAPWIASAVGSMLPLIVDSFRSGKSPEEAQKMIAPQRQAMIERLIGSGMNMQQAEAMTDEAMADEIAKAQLPEPMNPWLTAALAIGGGIGGYKLGAKFASKGTPTPDVSKEAKIDTPAEQAIAKPASGQAPSAPRTPDMVSPEELAPVQMRAEAMSRMQPSAIDVRNTRMLNGVPAPKPKDNPLSAEEIDRLINEAVPTPKSSPFPAKPMSASDEIAAKLEARQAYDAKLRSMDNTDPSLISAVDEMMPAGRPAPMGPFPARVEQGMVDDMMPSSAFRRPAPEFLPGEMQSRTPSASMRPWDDLPEIQAARARDAVTAGKMQYQLDAGPTRTVGELVGTPATASPFPASLARSMDRAPAVRNAQVGEALSSKQSIMEQIRRMQMERDWEQQELLARLGQ